MPLDVQLSRAEANLLPDLLRFAPELLLCLGIVGGLFVKLFRVADRVHLVPFGVMLTVAAGLLAATDRTDGEAFCDLIRLDRFAHFFRVFLLLTAALVLVLSRLTGLPDAADSADFVTLLLGGTLGMMLMASANHLLMVFLAVEMASLPGYVLAGFLKGKGRSSEAALKYVVYGAAASGVMLYGISLLAGRFGTATLPALAAEMGFAVRDGGFDLPTAAALLLIAVGLGFKLAVMPFQFWLPDVFDGAPAEVAALLAVGSKAAAIALTLRLLSRLFVNLPIVVTGESALATLAVVAALTATLGNVAALAQTSLKRLLAYSTIAHAGYLLMGVAALNPSAVLFYLLGYLPMTLGAFAVAAVLRDQTGSDEIEAGRGLLKRSPVLGVCTAVFLFSLLGLPPLAGFAGKFQVFAAVYQTGAAFGAAGHPWLGPLFNVVLAVGVVNTVISAGYYLKVLKAVGLDDPPADTPLGEGLGVRLLAMLLAAALVVGGVWWEPLLRLCWEAAASR